LTMAPGNYNYNIEAEEATDALEEMRIEMEQDDYYDRMESEHYLIDGVGFAKPGGGSALRAETANNPRNLPCPTCGEPNRLTPLDRRAGYQCDHCANQAEGMCY